MRQIAGTKRPIATPDDLVGIRMRVPAGALLADTFKALGAEPVTVNSDGIYDALKTGRVDAQENPLALVELFKLDEVVKYVSMTNHMWSGFNLIAHLPTWKRLPADITAVIERNATKYVRLQRRDQEQMNTAARATLAAPRSRVQRRRRRAVPREARGRLQHVERTTRHQVLDAAREKAQRSEVRVGDAAYSDL